LPIGLRSGFFLAFFLMPVLFARAGEVTTVAGTGDETFNLLNGSAKDVHIGQPFGVEIGPEGKLYVTEVSHHRVLKVDLTAGTVTTVAGTGKKGSGGNGGPATAAGLWEPYEVRFDKAGNLYFVEMKGAVVRKVDAGSGTISTIAGTGKNGFSGDGGPATQADLKAPHSIALDQQGGLYIADIGNHRIRRVDLASGIIETIAGTGVAKNPPSGSVATGQPIRGPRALYIDGDILWIALREGHSIWKLDLKTKRLEHVAGSGMPGFHDGPGSEALFNGPKGIVVGADGFVYVMDTENQAVRKLDPKTGIVTTVAGNGPQTRGFGGDGGPPLLGRFDRPHGITIDAQGNLYLGDTNNHRVRKVAP